MQAKKEGSNKKTEKRNVGKIVLNCIVSVVWLTITIFTSVLICGVCLGKELEIWRIIAAGVCMIFVLGILATKIFFVEILEIRCENKIKPYMITASITLITTLIIPLILQGVYRATEDNIVITENTSSVSEQIIYFTDEDEIAKQIQVATENDVIQVTFEENVQPYVEVLQYCTTVTTDNQNPWGKKYTETVKEWKQYEFHLQSAETSN